jgi:hypothetical protein
MQFMGITIKSKSLIYVVFKKQFAADSLPNYDIHSTWTKTFVYIFFYSTDVLGGSLRFSHTFRLNVIFFVLYNSWLIIFRSRYPGKPVESVSQMEVLNLENVGPLQIETSLFDLKKTRLVFSRPVTRMWLQKNRVLLLAANEICTCFE